MGRPILPPPPPPPTPPIYVHVHVQDTSFPILATSIVGMVTTALLLLSYYIFVTKCRLISWDHRPDICPHREGLDESVIQAIPTLRFRNSGGSTSFHDCAVCLNEFQEQEKIRMLPNCYHVFHIDCVDTWLQSHSNCPICRADITSTIRAGIPIARHPNGESVAIEVRDDNDDDDDGSSDRETEESSRITTEKKRKKKRVHRVASVGDECIDLREFKVQPIIRRSFSMDSMGDRELLMTVQEILKQNTHFRAVGSGRVCRSFFSFGCDFRSN